MDEDFNQVQETTPATVEETAEVFDPAAQDYEVIPDQAIEFLLSNPQTVGMFDQRFGAGRGAAILQENNPAPEPTPPAVESTATDRVYQQIWRGMGSTVNDLGYGAQEAVNETADFVYEPFEETFGINPDWRSRITMFEQPDDMLGGVVAGITQFGVGFVGAGRLTGLTKLSGAFINGAIADYVVFNPEDPNIAAMLDEWGYDAPIVTELLSTDPDDPDYINRLRNAGEGAAIGGIAEAIGWAVRARRARMNGDAEGAAAAEARQAEALRELDTAMQAEVADLAREAGEAQRFAETHMIDEVTPTAPRVDADGQMQLDLGDTPRATPTTTVEPPRGRISVTPEELRRGRAETRALEAELPVVNARGTGMRSPNTYGDFEQYLAAMNARSRVHAADFRRMGVNNPISLKTTATHAAVRLGEMAKTLGKDPVELYRSMQTANDGDIFNLHAEVMAQADAVKTANEELIRLSEALSTATTKKDFDYRRFGVKDHQGLEDAVLFAYEFATNVEAIRASNNSSIARAMRAMQEASKGDAAMRTALRKNAGADPTTIARNVTSRKTGKSAIQAAQEGKTGLHKIADLINSVRINFLLSGPGTQEVNLISSFVQSAMIPTTQFVGAASRGNVRLMEHSARQFAGVIGGYIDFINTVRMSGMYGDMDDVLKSSPTMQAFIKQEGILDPFNAKIEDDSLMNLENLGRVGDVITLPSRLLLTGDELFKQSQYRGRIYADANFEAQQRGLRGDLRTDFIKSYIKNSYDAKGAATRKDALLQAQRATFTEPLDPGALAMIQKMAINHPTVRFIIPFIRTPVNLLSETTQYMPVVNRMISRRYKDNIAAGGVRAAQAQGKTIIGTGLVMMAGLMAFQEGEGVSITGAGPSDPRVRAAWMANNQPYAFRVENEDGSVTWHNYSRFEPFSNIFSIAADAAFISQDPYNEREEIPLVRALITAIADNTVNKTFTQGIYDAMAFFVGRPHEQDRALNNALGSFVPNVLNQTNGDEAFREIRGVMDSILSRTWLYNRVDPRRNVLGEVLTRTLPKYEPLGLFHEDRREPDVVMETILELGIATDRVSGMPSRRVPGPNQFDLAQIPYSDNQSLYDRWLEQIGTTEINGRTLRETLEAMITDPNSAFSNAPPGAPGAVVRGTRPAIIARVISDYRTKARSEIPQLVELLRAEETGMGALLRTQASALRPERTLIPRLTPGLDAPLPQRAPLFQPVE